MTDIDAFGRQVYTISGRRERFFTSRAGSEDRTARPIAIPDTYIYKKHNPDPGELHGEREDLQVMRGQTGRQEHDLLPLSYVWPDRDWTMLQLPRPEREVHLLQVRLLRTLGVSNGKGSSNLSVDA